MKNRTIPFGYSIVGGLPRPCLAEIKVLQRAYRAYLSGDSLQSISEALNREKIEFMPGHCGWNKSRLARILTDSRYLGDSTYPQIVDRKDFESTAEIMQRRNSQAGMDRSLPIYGLSVPVLCPVCGRPMKRKRLGKTCVIKEAWACQNPDCRKCIHIWDEDFFSQISEIMEHLRQEPERLSVPDRTWEPTSQEIQNLKSEIETLRGKSPLDVDRLTQLYLDLAARKFETIPDIPFVTAELRATFKKTGPICSTSVDAMNCTLRSILLFPDGTVELALMNGQRFREEDFHGGTALAKTGLENADATKAGGYGTEPVSPETGSGLLPGVHRAGGAAE